MEGAIDLDALDRQVAQDTQRRIAGTEVVNTDGNAQSLKCLNDGQASLGCLQRAFCNFQLK